MSFFKKFLQEYYTIIISNSLDPDILSGLICVESICKGYSSRQKLPLARKEKTWARSRWGSIANLHAKVFAWLPQLPAVPPRGMTLVTEWKFCSICFLSVICENTHKVWYKNLWNWHVNDIWPFDLTSRSPVWH